MDTKALLPVLLGLAACVPRTMVVEPLPTKGPPTAAEDTQAPDCREPYTKSILIPDGRLGSPELRPRVNAILEAEKVCPPQSFTEHGAAALALMVRDRHERALYHANRAVDVDPTSPDGFAIRGMVHANNDANDEAEADFRRALAIDPDHKVALLELGLIFKSRGDLDGAKRNLGHAASAHPKWVIASHLLAKIFIDGGDLTGAEPHCNAVLQEIHDDEMAVCRGLGRAQRGEHVGVLEDLTDYVFNDLSSAHEDEIDLALRNAYMATGKPLLAAEHICLATGSIDEAECEDQEVVEAVEAARALARAAASDDSYATAERYSASKFAKEVKRKARDVKDLSAFVHPEIGVFVFRMHGWTLDHAESWPAIEEAQPALALADLRALTRLPKHVGWETNELDCSYTLDGIQASGFDVGLSTYFSAGTTSVPDIYRLADVREDHEPDMTDDRWKAMQRAALVITHEVVHSGEVYEFGQIDGQWYLLAVVVAYDPENDACG